MTSGDRGRHAGTLWVALFIFSCVYPLLFLLLRDRPLIGFLGAGASWAVSAWAAFAVVVLVLITAGWLLSGRRPSGAEPSFGPIIPARWARRTGIPGTDRFGAVLAIVAATLALPSVFWFPWLVAVSLVFIYSSTRVTTELWPIHPRRQIPTPPPLPTLDPADTIVEREWSWSCRCRPVSTSIRLSVRVKAVEFRATSNPTRGGVFADDLETVVRQLVEDGSEDREAAEAARQLLAFARANRFNYFEEAQNTLQFAQVIPYTTDRESKGAEYFRYAVETLHDNTGDCDCKAILAATLFRLMGLRSVVLISADERHAAVAVEGAPDFPGNRYFEWNGGRFYFCETTDGSFSFTVGEVPPSVDLDRYTARIEIAPGLLTAAGV